MDAGTDLRALADIAWEEHAQIVLGYFASASGVVAQLGHGDPGVEKAHVVDGRNPELFCIAEKEVAHGLAFHEDHVFADGGLIACGGEGRADRGRDGRAVIVVHEGIHRDPFAQSERLDDAPAVWQRVRRCVIFAEPLKSGNEYGENDEDMLFHNVPAKVLKNRA